MSAQPEAAKPPHPLLRVGEIAAVQEYAAFYALRGYLSLLPKGDGHPVLVLPGFMADDPSTRPMRSLLIDLGYDAYGWGLGPNITVNDERMDKMLAVLVEIHKMTGRKVSIIGWSLGGIFARELAKAVPEMVRLVISLGSPISNDRGHSAVHHLFEHINGSHQGQSQSELGKDLETAPPVPTTSIYTKTDGVVSWQGSIQRSEGETENIEVRGTHCGLGFNPAVMMAVADRLQQKEDGWGPFDRNILNAAFFPSVA